MINFRQVHDDLKSGKLDINELQDDKAEYFAYGQRILTNNRIDIRK